jgi:hypothetical protein
VVLRSGACRAVCMCSDDLSLLLCELLISGTLGWHYCGHCTAMCTCVTACAASVV